MHRNCTSQIGWTGVSGVGVRVFFVFMYIIYIFVWLSQVVNAACFKLIYNRQEKMLIYGLGKN